MSNELKWIEVYQADNSIEAHLLKGLLEKEGIQVQLQGEALFGAMGEIPLEQAQMKLLVVKLKQQQARQILIEYEQYRSQASQPWVCPNCGEENEPSFELCWQCNLDPHEQAESQ